MYCEIIELYQFFHLTNKLKSSGSFFLFNNALDPKQDGFFFSNCFEHSQKCYRKEVNFVNSAVFLLFCVLFGAKIWWCWPKILAISAIYQRRNMLLSKLLFEFECLCVFPSFYLSVFLQKNTFGEQTSRILEPSPQGLISSEIIKRLFRLKSFNDFYNWKTFYSQHLTRFQPSCLKKADLNYAIDVHLRHRNEIWFRGGCRSASKQQPLCYETPVRQERGKTRSLLVW